MKKVLSLVLAVVMVIGMSTSAFAFLTISGNAYTSRNISLGTITLNDQGTITNINTNQLASSVANRTITVRLTNSDLSAGANFSATNWAANPNYSVIVPSGIDGLIDNVTVNWGNINSNYITLTFTLRDGAAIDSYDSFVDIVQWTGAATPTEVRRLTVRVSASVVTPSSNNYTTTIPSNVKIIGIANQAGPFYTRTWTANTSFDYFDFTGDDKAEYKLIPEDFVWEWTSGAEKGKTVSVNEVNSWADGDLRSAHLQDIGVRKTNPVGNSGTIRDVTIDGTNVRIRTVTFFVNTASAGVDGSMDLQLSYKNQVGGQKCTVTFNISNEKIEVEEDDDIAFTDDHVYVQATDVARNVVMEVGGNLFITKNFGKDQKAYCRATLELSAGDEKLFQQYAELDSVYTLYHTGVASANVTAEFRDLNDTYFVYDENFKLIGTTADSKLPWSPKYYLTTKKVNLAGTEVEEPTASEPTDPTDLGNAGTGGGSGVVNNYNPNTGA